MAATHQVRTRARNPFFQQRNKDIAHRALVLRQSDSEIGKAWGMEAHTVRAIRRDLGIRSNITSDAGAKRTHEKLTALSPLHQQIGVKLDARRNLIAKQTPTEFSFMLRVTRMRLRKMELGAWDFTLSELTRIADMMGVPVHELVRQAAPVSWMPPKRTRRPTRR